MPRLYKELLNWLSPPHSFFPYCTVINLQFYCMVRRLPFQSSFGSYFGAYSHNWWTIKSWRRCLDGINIGSTTTNNVTHHSRGRPSYLFKVLNREVSIKDDERKREKCVIKNLLHVYASTYILIFCPLNKEYRILFCELFLKL